MKTPHFLFFFFLSIFTTKTFAEITVYTNSSHLPELITSDTQVIYLDEVEHLQQKLFGELSTDPAQAEQAASAILHSSDWKAKERQLIAAYQRLLKAYSLSLTKYPAVVFDDRFVVYGTTDISFAQSKLTEYLEAQ